MKVARVLDDRNRRDRSKRNRALTSNENKWMRFRMAVLRAACCFAAFWFALAIVTIYLCMESILTCAMVQS